MAAWAVPDGLFRPGIVKWNPDHSERRALDKPEIERIVSHYPNASPIQRWHMRGRLALCPYEALLKHLTGPENILDVGCGFGHLAWYLDTARKGLRYFGTDIDARKIALARGSHDPEAKSPEFKLGDVREVPGLPRFFGNIVFLDVLYLMPWNMQMRVMEWALARLAPGADSVLLIKTMDQAEGFSGFRAVAEEWIMVRLLRRTVSSGSLNGARSASDYLDFARGLGFQGQRESLRTFNPSSILTFRRSDSP
ncbi:MAG: class I SAM-dependent methyltransferase [Fibrobacterota bacterium]|nr:class I SAM-dependent methyltransferase [Fibrobacterota bacterium]